MDTSLPLYLVGPFAEGGALLLDGGGGGVQKVTRVSDAEAFPDSGSMPGWVLFSPGLPDSVVLGLLCRMGRTAGPWSPLLFLENPEGGNGEPRLLPLSPGVLVSAGTFQRRLKEEDSGASLLSLRLLHVELARIRHDVNNPLTTALAEVQLLLMDRPQASEEVESLKVVEAQLKRIRDMVAQLPTYRVSGW